MSKNTGVISLFSSTILTAKLAQTILETQFVGAVGRVSVYDHFTTSIVESSVIDFGLGDFKFKFIATYTHLMDSRNAYIRIVAYQHGCNNRCDSDFGEFYSRDPSSHFQLSFVFMLSIQLDITLTPTITSERLLGL